MTPGQSVLTNNRASAK